MVVICRAPFCQRRPIRANPKSCVSLSKHKFAVEYLRKNNSFGGRIVLGIAIAHDCPSPFVAQLIQTVAKFFSRIWFIGFFECGDEYLD